MCHMVAYTCLHKIAMGKAERMEPVDAGFQIAETKKPLDKDFDPDDCSIWS